MIGRHFLCDLSTACGAASQRHAALEHGDDGWTIIDLKSISGTVASGRRVGRKQPHPIAVGDHIRVGPSTFIVHAEPE